MFEKLFYGSWGKATKQQIAWSHYFQTYIKIVKVKNPDDWEFVFSNIYGESLSSNRKAQSSINLFDWITPKERKEE
jgi:hypothetical protein